MTFTSYDQAALNPTESGHAVLTQRSNSNFFVAPMGKGRNARLVEKVEEEDDNPMSGVGFSIMGSVIGGALGLGPMFEVAFEAMKTGLEMSESSGSAVSFVPDVNLNPAAILRPDLAFNFKSFTPSSGMSSNGVKLKVSDEEDKPKRTWSSGEGDFLLAARFADQRRRSVLASPVVTSKGLTPGGRESKSGK